MAEENENKNKAAVELGRRGGQKTAERGPEYYAEIQAKRKERKGGRPKNPPKASHSGKLPVGSLSVPVFVLEDGTRVITQRGLQTTIGMSTSGGSSGAHRTANVVRKLEDKLNIGNELSVRMSSPLVLMPPQGGMRAYGYEATTLIDICELLLQARDANPPILLPSQTKYAVAADIVIRAFAKVGIVAVIDEVTGYQEIRDREALQAILDKFLRQEFAAWAKRFPDEFYRQIFRLKGWAWKGMKPNRPQVVAHYTKDVVYSRLAPGILHQLEQRNPKDDKGNRKSKHHQWLTEEIGHPALAQHLYAVIGLMRISNDWNEFKKLMDRAYPKRGDTLQLPLFSADGGN